MKQLRKRLALKIHFAKPRRWAPGSYASGHVGPFEFDAVVFAEHALNPAWEIGRSRISKLSLRRVSDGRYVYTWDRGLDIPAADAETQRALECVTAKLADVIHGPEEA